MHVHVCIPFIYQYQKFLKILHLVPVMHIYVAKKIHNSLFGVLYYTPIHMHVHMRKIFQVVSPDSNSKISLHNCLLPISVLTSLQTPIMLPSFFIIRIMLFNILRLASLPSVRDKISLKNASLTGAFSLSTVMLLT